MVKVWTVLWRFLSNRRSMGPMGSTHCACHHWRPNLPGCCCICLEQSAGVSTQYGHRRHCKFFAADWRPIFLHGRTAAL